MANEKEATHSDAETRLARRNYKDTLFRMVFREKTALLSLYNAVNGTCYSNEEELKVITLENAIYMNVKNDVAFVVDFYINLYEHQSTFSPNMPLRNLIYITKELQGQIDQDQLYRRTLVKIPTPRFLVFYNGTERQPEKKILRLSDAFERLHEYPQLELIVTVLNINEGMNRELLEDCRQLKEYMLYINKVRTYARQSGLNEGVERAIKECIQENILKDLLTKYRNEVMEMCLFECNIERAQQFIIEDLREELRVAMRDEIKEEVRDEVKEEVRDEMKEEVRDEVAKEIEDEVREEAFERSQQTMIKTACKMFQKSVCAADIADFLDEDLSVIECIGTIAARHPEYGSRDIFLNMQSDYNKTEIKQGAIGSGVDR